MWKPIKTAPKDGTKIIGRDADGNFSVAHFCKNGINCYWELEVPGSWADSAYWEPVYWHPLPEFNDQAQRPAKGTHE